ncbi:MAG: glycosyltransferase family 2 protein [Motiliproteus sp.]
MTLFISVVSHGHDELISDNHHLMQLAGDDSVQVVVRDNLASERLKALCLSRGYHYLPASSPLGFGANNNRVFDYCCEQLNARDGDYFCLLNPDLVIEPEVLLEAVTAAEFSQERLCTINLFQDEQFSQPDLNIKRFPSLLDFAKGFVLGKNPAAYDKSQITEPCSVDWASGAFLLFRVDLYQQLEGFDERFFMYLEDVDICRRARDQFGVELRYLPQFKAVHLCQQANKSVFSKHFLWFITSMLKYFAKHGWTR